MNIDTRPEQQARLECRRHARRIAGAPQDMAAHLARVNALLAIDRVEPVQGALADLFVSAGADRATVKSAALLLASARLPAHVRERFAAWVPQGCLPRVTPLATRWSMLARPSGAVSTRARRCGVDDSRAAAERVLAAVRMNELGVQEEFLHHCLTCRDTLAFMLARRSLLKAAHSLPPGWREVGRFLEGQIS